MQIIHDSLDVALKYNNEKWICFLYKSDNGYPKSYAKFAKRIAN